MLKNTNSKGIILFMVLLGFFAACTSDDEPFIDPNDCSSVSYDPGIVSQELDLGGCFMEKEEDNYVIDDSTEYAALKSAFSQSLFCEESNFPSIDFEEYTLLGLWSDGGGCTINYYRSVADLSDSKEYLYTVTVQSCGFCEMYGFSYNWVLVPTLPIDYTVRFQLKSL